MGFIEPSVGMNYILTAPQGTAVSRIAYDMRVLPNIPLIIFNRSPVIAKIPEDREGFPLFRA